MDSGLRHLKGGFRLKITMETQSWKDVSQGTRYFSVYRLSSLQGMRLESVLLEIKFRG